MPALLIFAFVLFQTGPKADEQTSGLQALDRGDFRAAEQIFSRLAATDPKDYSAFFNLALAETALHEDEKGVAHLRQTLALKPNLYEAELNLGLLLLRNARAKEAIPLLQDAGKQRPAEARPKRYLGDSLLAAEDYATASSAYQQALQIDPRSANAELGLGQSLQRQGLLDEALPHYGKAAALDPKLKSYLLELAEAYEKQQHVASATSLLKEFPDDPAVREKLGQLYLASNQPALAVEQFRSAVSQAPTAANQLALATAYLRDNQTQLALPILERALAAAPGDFDLQMVVGRIRRDDHNYRAAANQFVAAAALKPTSVEAWNEAATAFVLSEQYPQAIAALDRVHALNADTAGDYYYRAIALDKLKQKKPAIASYQKFLEMSGGKFPDQEFNARHRSKTLEHEVNQ